MKKTKRVENISDFLDSVDILGMEYPKCLQNLEIFSQPIHIKAIGLDQQCAFDPCSLFCSVLGYYRGEPIDTVIG